ncbi:carbohydrate kinase [Sulfitobacter sp. TSTF-M16]|uniref:Carbohydrate kinase n=1 Tax=Sulfitobacter aestuariivivens TaxID=2766981 RepID=A0A927D7J2_9RHOB|nr:carbohydrate kinase [Sulfitobacter aestuariivivens]MBD3664216.1 carbohydrate kinase [Sulfitobacter aestuariivivens]
MILCCGEALIDMLPRQSAAGEATFAPHSGGAVFNTAIALGRLDQPTGLLSGVSTDMFGQRLQRDLAESRVDTARLILSDRPCTLAFVELTAGQARYSFYDENTAGRMIAPADVPALGDEITALFFGGISLAVDPCAETYAGLLHDEGVGRVVMIDPNIRPSFVKDEARYRDRLTGLIERSNILKISDEDLDWLVAGKGSSADKIDQLRKNGPDMVILTRGSAGAVAVLADGTQVTVPAQKAAVVDTVGAGDTFNAGILASLADQDLLNIESIQGLTSEAATQALQFAAKVAAVTVSRAGANPPWAHELTD